MNVAAFGPEALASLTVAREAVLAEVTFDADRHRYFFRDRAVPGVSTILRTANIRPAPYMGRTVHGVDVMKRALQRGRDVHRITRAIDEAGDELDALDDRFDPADLSPENVNYVSAYHRFLRESGYRALAWETLVYHGEYDYCGRPDMVGWLGPYRILGDRKTDRQLHRAVVLQLAAYREAWNWCHPNQPIDRTYALKLNADTTYELVRNKLEPGDFPFFVGALWVKRFQELTF